MPTHSHSLAATSVDGTQATAAGNQLARAFVGTKAQTYTGNYLSIKAPNISLSPQAMSIAGSGFPHNNMQPYLTVNYCIAMQGVFPARP
jgi:microcystin-dependent protein